MFSVPAKIFEDSGPASENLIQVHLDKMQVFSSNLAKIRGNLSVSLWTNILKSPVVHTNLSYFTNSYLVSIIQLYFGETPIVFQKRLCYYNKQQQQRG